MRRGRRRTDAAACPASAAGAPAAAPSTRLRPRSTAAARGAPLTRTERRRQPRAAGAPPRRAPLDVPPGRPRASASAAAARPSADRLAGPVARSPGARAPPTAATSGHGVPCRCAATSPPALLAARGRPRCRRPARRRAAARGGCRAPLVSWAPMSAPPARREDPRRGRVAVRERPAAHRPRGGLRRPVGHLRPLPPARGNDVLMVSGTDEHGTPIMVAADQEGVSPRELADRYNEIIREDLRRLGLSYDLFTRTTTAEPPRASRGTSSARSTSTASSVEQTTVGAFSADDRAARCPTATSRARARTAASPSARGDQCDNCGNQLDPADLIEPRSKIDGAAAGLPRDDAPLPRPARVQGAAAPSGSASRSTGARTSAASRSSSSTS